MQVVLPEEFPLVVDALPVLSSRLVHDDKKSVETSCLALSRLADSYKHDTKKLTEIARDDILSNLQQLLGRRSNSTLNRLKMFVQQLLSK